MLRKGRDRPIRDEDKRNLSHVSYSVPALCASRKRLVISKVYVRVGSGVYFFFEAVETLVLRVLLYLLGTYRPTRTPGVKYTTASP